MQSIFLRQMAMPQIQINPVSEAVTDNAGGEVAIFINFLEASKEEMEGLRTPDVKKVEYLEFPTDPRFRGAQRVINIIVQEYAYGGYTKLTTNETAVLKRDIDYQVTRSGRLIFTVVFTARRRAARLTRAHRNRN